jgi:hypothetical protein
MNDEQVDELMNMDVSIESLLNKENRRDCSYEKNDTVCPWALTSNHRIA